MDLFIRLTYSYTQLGDLMKLISSKSSSVVVYEHSGKQVHIHALVKGCIVSTDTLKNYVRKFVGSVPKTAWSFKTATSDDCIKYMSKGKLEPVFVHNYDIERIQKYKSEWEDYSYAKQTHKGMKQFVIKETQKESKLRQGEMIDECIRRLTVNGNKPRGREIVEMIRQVVVIENRTIVGRFKYRDYYDTIMARMEHTKNDFMFAVGAMCAKDFFAT